MTLTEQLAAAEDNLAIAKFEEAREWQAYFFVYDEYVDGRTTQDVLDEYWQRAMRYTANRNEKQTHVAHLKALETEAAALREARDAWAAERMETCLSYEALNNYAIMRTTLPSFKANCERNARAYRLAAGVFAAQVAGQGVGR